MCRFDLLYYSKFETSMGQVRHRFHANRDRCQKMRLQDTFDQIACLIFHKIFTVAELNRMICAYLQVDSGVSSILEECLEHKIVYKNESSCKSLFPNEDLVSRILTSLHLRESLTDALCPSRCLIRQCVSTTSLPCVRRRLNGF